MRRRPSPGASRHPLPRAGEGLQLRELARLYSIQVTYEDAAGKKRNVPRESLLAALKMRMPDGADLKDALRERKERFWSRMAEPVTVVWGRRTPMIELHLPQSGRDATLEWELALEDNTSRAGRIDLSSRPAEWSEEHFVGKTMSLPERLPPGYHVLRLNVAGQKRETFIIAAPSKAHPLKARSWGIFAPLYAAQTERSWGCGDLADMQAYRTWINELGGGVVATLPMLASFEDEPSPYSPVSRLFWNEMYLDVTPFPEFDSADVDPFAIESLTSSQQIDYQAINREKRRVLEKMAARFRSDDDFRAFAMRGAYGYAHFRAAKEDRQSADYHLYVQYRMAQQMREVSDSARSAGVGLYLDFPLGVNPEGFDAWKYVDVFAEGASVGAPPDLFFTKGQNWGFRPFDPDTIRERRYGYFRDCIRHHVSHAGILRLDHVMGLHRLFWIPKGGEPKDGVYIRYAEEELYAVVVLESRRHRCAIVGEDLGTVPPYVPRMMAKHGLRRMYVVQYEPLSTPPVESVASLNTHDMPTFAGFWTGLDIDNRLNDGLLDGPGARQEREKRRQIREALVTMLKARGLLEEGEGDLAAVLKAVLGFLAESPAEIVLVNLEDLWLETNPQNVPGMPERSWRNRFRYTLEQMRGLPDVADTLRMIKERRKEADGGTT